MCSNFRVNLVKFILRPKANVNFVFDWKSFCSHHQSQVYQGQVCFKFSDFTIRLTKNLHIFVFLSKNLDIYTSENGFHELYRIFERLFLRFVKTQSISILHEIRSVSCQFVYKVPENLPKSIHYFLRAEYEQKFLVCDFLSKLGFDLVENRNERDLKLVSENGHLIVKTRTLNGVTSCGSNLIIICEKLERLFDFIVRWAPA